MVIKRRIEIEKVIDKGGQVSNDAKKKQWTIFNLRINQQMLQQIDEALEETVGISKTGWILQAIQDKLKKQKE